MVVVAIVLLVGAVATAAVSVAGLLERLPRNRWAGIRTQQAMASDAAFVLANKVAAPTGIATGFVFALGAFAAVAMPGISGIIAVGATAIAGVVVTGIGAVLGNRAAATVAADTGGCGNSCGGCSLRDVCQPG